MSEPIPFVPAIGRFEVREFLGRGAMGDVYLAFDPELEHDIALKYIRKSSADDDVLEAERRGAELQMQVSAIAPQVAKVHEYGDLDDVFFVSMEFVDGVDLSTVLRGAAGEPLEPRRAVDLAHQLCTVLEVLHGFSTEIDGKRITSVIHGDIKPENVRLQEGDRVRILDFGVAKHLSLTRKATRNLFGSYPYTPPERLATGFVDEASDLWAVGIILYMMASGRQPYPGTTPEALERQIRSAPPLPLPSSCPPGLRRVTERSVAFEPAKRYRTAAEMGEALTTLDGDDLLPGPPPLPAEEPTLRSTPDHQPVDSPEPADETTRRTGSNESGPSGPEDLEATRRTVEPTSVSSSEASSGELTPPPLPTARVSAPPPPRRLTDRARETWARQPRKRRRWILILLLLGAIFQIVAQSNARRVARELRSEAAPNVRGALERYRFAASLRPFDIGLGGARAALEKALVAEADRLIARFRGDTPTAVRRDWQQARDYLEAALELGRPSDTVRARLLYAQAQLDRIEAGSLRDEGRDQQAERKWDDAIFGFRRAAELDDEWPDPYLGLSRVYAYEQLDLEKLEQSLRSALSRGYPRGSREHAQIADAHFALGVRALGEAANLRGQRAERQRLYEAQRHFELAVIGYEQILSFGNARKNRDSVLRRLQEIVERLREIRRI